MSWTVACFCGNVYTAPPNGCEVCGCSIEPTTPGTTEPRSPSSTGSWISGAATLTQGVIDELAAPDIRFEYSLHKPLRGA
jgi:hypothetical protein